MENQELIAQCTATAQQWIDSPLYDAETKQAVKAMIEAEDKTPLIDAFYRSLEFGTGGLRGIMGPGTNRMNVYVVGVATQGLANYLLKNFADRKEISVVVGHDCRNNSRLFAETVANVFSANGIKVYLFEDLRPTPEVSFAIRHFGCQSGVNITASHNPREYNGYKAYWDDGAQVLAPHDKGIIDEVNKVSLADVKFEGNPALIQSIGKDVDDLYLSEVHKLSIDPEVIRRQKDLCIVYTPLHGAGRVLVPASLKLWGFENVHTVPEQMVKDGNFPTVVSPNPENGEALTLALNLAKNLNADIVMASDPDADRVGMACKNNEGEWVLIDGNQTCMIFLYYIIKNRIKETYSGGGEESYGVMGQDIVRDKDAVSACSLLAEICAWAKDQGKTLFDVLMDIYLEYGFSLNHTINVVKPGKSGADEIKAMMENFRTNAPKEIAGSPVVCTKDYETLKATDAEGHTTDLDFPTTSNVLQWFTADGTKISVRPSGTEPKIKFYIEVRGEMECPKCYKAVRAEALQKVEAVKKSLGL